MINLRRFELSPLLSLCEYCNNTFEICHVDYFWLFWGYLIKMNSGFYMFLCTGQVGQQFLHLIDNFTLLRQIQVNGDQIFFQHVWMQQMGNEGRIVFLINL